MKTYSEMCQYRNFIDRYEYLKNTSFVGDETFGGSRYLNQNFYRSSKWKRIRDKVIIRDNGCDLAIEDRVIYGKLIVHHINPITVEDVLNMNSNVFDLENLVCVSFDTHQAIHYGDDKLLFKDPIQRFPNDTAPWLN